MSNKFKDIDNNTYTYNNKTTHTTFMMILSYQNFRFK